MTKYWDTEDGNESPYEDKKIELEEAIRIIASLQIKTSSQQEHLEKTGVKKIQFVRTNNGRGGKIAHHHVTRFTGTAADLKKLREGLLKV